jgi:predicted aspartyl protease
MPIKNTPFTTLEDSVRRPYLSVKIINPCTGKSYKTYGLVDTGADECAVPASIAKIIGHDLQAGEPKDVDTGNGTTIAYKHITQIEIYHTITHELLYTIKDTPIDFMPNLHMFLLGANNFLSKFILNIDYPKQVFSIKYPEP